MEDTIASRPGRTPMPTTRPPRLPLLLFAFFLFPFLLASSPPDDPEDLVRRANAAVARGDAEAAEKLYAAAEERTADPGLVAFNMGAVLFPLGAFRDAELHYARAAEDAPCPPERPAEARSTRGPCLLRL